MRERGEEVKEFKSLEIDVEKGIYRLNGEELKYCQEITITIKPEKVEVYTVTNQFESFEALSIAKTACS